MALGSGCGYIVLALFGLRPVDPFIAPGDEHGPQRQAGYQLCRHAWAWFVIARDSYGVGCLISALDVTALHSYNKPQVGNGLS